MTPSTDPLDTLLAHAERERNDALAAFNQSRARGDAARAQARQLDEYRAGYRERWSLRLAQGAGLDIVRCYQTFADRLETAIAQQAHALALAQAAQARTNDTLAAHELRVAGVRKLIERRTLALRQQAEQREQRQSDEQAARAFTLRRLEATRLAGARA